MNNLPATAAVTAQRQAQRRHQADRHRMLRVAAAPEITGSVPPITRRRLALGRLRRSLRTAT